MVESSIHPAKLKTFIRHVCVIAKKHKDREDARSGLQSHIKKLGRISKKKGMDKEMDKEMKELDRKISLVLEKEMQLLGKGQEESEASRELMQNVEANRARIRQMNDSISELKDRLGAYIEMKTQRERRINNLEKKIRAEIGKKRNVSLLKSKLKSLEALYNKLKQKGVDVSRVESKIQDLKLRLMA